MIRSDNEDDMEAISRAVGAIINWDADRCISRVEPGVVDGNDRLFGGTLYSQYTGREGSICFTTAGFKARWINKDLLYATFHFPFVVCGVRKAFAQVKSTNQTSLRFCLHIGFKAESVIEHVYPDGDMLLLSMYRDECRWLDLKGVKVRANGQAG